MSTVIQRSFSGGEIAPYLYARVDTAKYATGARTIRNFQVMRHGGVQNRAGTKYLAEVKDSTKAVRLIPFIFNASQTYVLEFGNLYIRFYKNGAQLLSAGVPYEISTPYVEADLDELQFVQSADVVTLVHPNYAPRELSRTADTSWTLSTISFQPSISRPTGLTDFAGGSTGTYWYAVTAVNESTGEESLCATGTAKNITAITKANPCVVTSNAHGLDKNGRILIESVGGMTQLNGKEFIISAVTANTFTLLNVDSTNYTAYTAGGTAKPLYLKGTTAGTPSQSNPHPLAWTGVTGISRYNVYALQCNPTLTYQEGVFAFVGSTTATTYSYFGTSGDLTLQPPFQRLVFNATGDYPGAVNYFQQRLLFGNTTNDPETVYASRTGLFHNFGISTPVQDDDAVTWQLIGRQVNEVRHLLDLGRLVVLTSGGEWVVEGDSAGILLPSDVNPKQAGYNGANTIAPIVIGNNALFVQARGNIVRDFAFDFQVDGYKGNDLTIFAAHLFEGYTITAWAYAQVPHSIVWAVRSDGKLVALTYVPDQEVWGWHIHDTDGSYESVCVVPEGEEDVLYAVVNRTIDGSAVRYVERFYTRIIDEDAIEESVFVDCAKTYDGRNTGSTTMTLSGGTNWDENETLTCTASVATFAGTSADVGKAVHLTGADGTVYRCTITAQSSTTVCTVRPNRTIPVAASLRSAATTNWSLAIKVVSGLDHLEGEDVSVFADGFVVANPNNPAYNGLTVSSGIITLDAPKALIHVGLPYTCDLETLDMDSVQGETMVDKRKLLGKVTLQLYKSRGAWVGPKAPASDELDTEELTELKYRDTEGYDEPNDLVTGPVSINIRPEWNSNGRVFVRQSDPIPLAVLSVAPAGYIPLR